MPANDDPFDLDRYIAAQSPVIEQVLTELHAGHKHTHWMWFVFPQAEGLGFSHMSQKYAIRSPAEARAFLDHPVLGERLGECVRLVLESRRPLAEIFGAPDDLKFRSCMTLFAAVAPQERIFTEALTLCCDGEADRATTAWLSSRRDA